LAKPFFFVSASFRLQLWLAFPSSTATLFTITPSVLKPLFSEIAMRKLLGLILTLALCVPGWSQAQPMPAPSSTYKNHLKLLILDDPIQSMDEVHIEELGEVLNANLRKSDKEQVGINSFLIAALSLSPAQSGS
jgi:hypothetical protein